jgi:hypothetical protein
MEGCPNCLTDHNETYLEIDAVTKATREIPCRPKIVELCEANVRLKSEMERLKSAEFWNNWVYPEGATPEQIQNELQDYHELLGRVAKVYGHITHGRISKQNTLAEVVIEVADQCAQEEIDEALSEPGGALARSVDLQSHYARLLNIYDGGSRLSFSDAQAWIDRLALLLELSHGT